MKPLIFFVILFGSTFLCQTKAYSQEQYCFFSDNSTSPGYNQLLVFEHFSPLVKYDESEMSSDELARSWYNYLRERLSRHDMSFNSYSALCRSDKSGLVEYRQKLIDKSKALDNEFSHHKTWDYKRDYFSNVNARAWPRWEYHHLFVQ